MGSVNSHAAHSGSHFFWAIAPVLLVFLPICSYLICKFHLARRRGKHGYETTARLLRKHQDKQGEQNVLHYEYQYDRTRFVWNHLLHLLLIEIGMEIPNEIRSVIVDFAGNSQIFWNTIRIRESVTSKAYELVHEGDEVKIRADPKYVLSCQLLLDNGDNTAPLCHVEPGWLVAYWTVLSIFALTPSVFLYYFLISPFIMEHADGLLSEILLEILMICALVTWTGTVAFVFVQTQRQGFCFECCCLGPRPELRMSEELYHNGA